MCAAVTWVTVHVTILHAIYWRGYFTVDHDHHHRHHLHYDHQRVKAKVREGGIQGKASQNDKRVLDTLPSGFAGVMMRMTTGPEMMMMVVIICVPVSRKRS